MPTEACPDCGREVSTVAAACPGCGRPIAPQPQTPACPHCGAHTVGKARGVHGVGEVLICAVLLLMCLVPGIVYYIYMESVPYCTSCGRRAR